MRNDPELVFWHRTAATWDRLSRGADDVLWSRLHLPSFPGIAKFQNDQLKWNKLHDTHMINGDENQATKSYKRGLTAGRWARVLEYALRKGWVTWLKTGSSDQRTTYRQMCRVTIFRQLLSMGRERMRTLLERLEHLTRFRMYTKTRVLICTVDSVEYMVRTMEQGTLKAALAVGDSAQLVSTNMAIDTVIMDEAACVLETSVPVLLALEVKNLTLVGDPYQLQPFSIVRHGEGGRYPHEEPAGACPPCRGAKSVSND